MSDQPHSSTQPISVLLADDEPLIRQSLRIVIDSQPDLHVVGEASNGDETVQAARRLKPDVILMDIRMPGSDGIHATQAITADPALRGVRVLVLSMYELDEYVYGALRAGASGFLLKDAHPATLLDAIRRVCGGEALFAPSILTKLVDHYVSDSNAARTAAGSQTLARLTPRETEVLVLVAQGLSNDEITAELHVSNNTVKTHISNLLAKLHARDRAQLVIAAYEHGMAAVKHRR
ncbi:response regulator transcription factor [Paeniglutamicibacter psychrophenolicus]|uniref:DNA-binding NarL/FixJ family response regulator n=1 Tax=Paeniglutamicibacter psychrophenolicus TaxID=257454 RepID=A0ABS4W890_9MICC|nr:response regulator transcription factor [Paeniglutamicibacter psychrophenolicus]MBP2372427.1 DNA-binding NarL/FixJ family response regulator [Paeniglutamicibacter psychrophenolicus]